MTPSATVLCLEYEMGKDLDEYDFHCHVFYVCRVEERLLMVDVKNQFTSNFTENTLIFSFSFHLSRKAWRKILWTEPHLLQRSTPLISELPAVKLQVVQGQSRKLNGLLGTTIMHFSLTCATLRGYEAGCPICSKKSDLFCMKFPALVDVDVHSSEAQV